MNADSNYPQFGPYSNTTAFAMQQSATYSFQNPTGEFAAVGNITTTGPHGDPPILANDFYQDATPFGNTTPAFTPSSSSYATTPAGDQYKLSTATGSSGYPARNVNEIIGDKIWTIRDTNNNSLLYEPTAWTKVPVTGYQTYPMTGNTYDGSQTGSNHTNMTLSVYSTATTPSTSSSNPWDYRLTSNFKLPYPGSPTPTAASTTPPGVQLTTPATSTTPYVQGTSQTTVSIYQR
jgi:hypothetical protein